jgi:2-dehydropantoate 2-reductase
MAQPSVAVIGAGAIGGILAARLARAGYEPQVVCKHVDLAELARAPGLHVTGVGGEVRAAVRAVETPAQLSPPLEVVFHATKATDMLEAAREVAPLMGPEGLMVSLQNGICEEALAKVAGRGRVAGCVVGFGATMHGPAELEMTSGGEFVLGSLDGRDDPRLEPVREMLATAAPCRLSANILGELYAKLIINSCINSLGAITGLRLGEMLARLKARRVFIAVMREAMRVARAMDLEVPPGAGGKLDYQSFLQGSGPLGSLRRHLMIRLIGFRYRRLKSSSLQSLERGKPTEIDYLNGYIVAKGRELGQPTPVNSRLAAMVKEIEAGSRRLGPENLQEVPAP